jgi:hypothetical protein
MQPSLLTLRTTTVPTALLIAAIDYVNHLRPAPRDIDTAVVSLALRLAYDDKTAMALSVRVRATARMFAYPLWPVVRALGHAVGQDMRGSFEDIVQRFIATAPLDAALEFEVESLQRILLAELPVQGRG